RIWDVTSGKERQHWEEMCDFVFGAAFHQKGNVLLTVTMVREAGILVGTVRARDLTSGKVLRQFSFQLQGILSLAFSADRTRVAVSGEERRSRDRNLLMDVFDVGRGKRIQRIENLPGLAFNLAISPDNRLIAAVIEDADASRVMVWEIATGSLRCEFVGTAVR